MGRTLREWRIELGGADALGNPTWTGAQMARHLGIARQTYSGYENGKVTPGPKVLARMTKVLGERPVIAQPEAELAAKVDALTEEVRLLREVFELNLGSVARMEIARGVEAAQAEARAAEAPRDGQPPSRRPRTPRE